MEAQKNFEGIHLELTGKIIDAFLQIHSDDNKKLIS